MAIYTIIGLLCLFAGTRGENEYNEGVRVFTPCVTNAQCAQMNGECFSSRGNDLTPVCSCPEGTFFDAVKAVCDRDGFITDSNITVIHRVKSSIFYMEQKDQANLTRGLAQFPTRWVCARNHRFCRAEDRNVYYTSLDIDSIDTDDSQVTYMRYSDVMWKCTGGRIFYRRNDDMSTDADTGSGMRPAHENCLTPQELCSAIGTGTAGADGECNCNDGWTGPTCQIRLSLDIERPVSPTRTCTFPSSAACNPGEICYMWEKPSGTVLSNPSAGHAGWCWCGPDYIPAAVIPDSVTNDACIRSTFFSVYGVPALPYTPRAPSYNLQVDARTRSYMHYTGQGYRYASVAPYPINTSNTLLRINDTMFEESGYLWRCDAEKATYNPTTKECDMFWVPPSPEDQANDDLFVFTYANCDSTERWGPFCSWNETECRHLRCSDQGYCTGTHQGCLCDRGWGGYNCSIRACGPNEIDIPAVFVTVDFEQLQISEPLPAKDHPHVWSEELQKCNCSVSYKGQFCEEYTCGNKHTVYDTTSSKCTCIGFWTLNTTSGLCTNNTCPLIGYEADKDDAFSCVAMDPDTVDPRTYVLPPVEEMDPQDDRYPPASLAFDSTTLSTISLAGVSIGLRMFTILLSMMK